MVKCLENQGWSYHQAKEHAKTHPRVTFKDSDKFSFIPSEYHYLFQEAAA